MDKNQQVIISGASGLVGAALRDALRAHGHVCHPLVRTLSTLEHDAITWDPAHGVLDAEALEGHDAVVHLAGEPIADGRWTPIKKQRILESRVQSTQLITERLAGLARPPKVLISASAIGYYGNRGAEALEEGAPAGTGFLSEVCQAWEDATAAASASGIRVVNLRIGLVLSPKGGAFARMLTPFRLGLGGPLGSGQMYMSWITLDDLVRAICFAIENETLSGPLNAVAPNPVTNKEFTRALARALKRPALLSTPECVLRKLLGEMAEELLLSSTRVVPARLAAAGFNWNSPDIATACQKLLAT